MTELNAGDPSSEIVVRDAARAGDLDRYLAALLAPRRVRGDLIALTAFLGEIARIPEAVSEPMMGEIRLQWWRDALETGSTRTGSPIADALLQTIARHQLPLAPFQAMLEAHAHALMPDALATEEDLVAHLEATDGVAFMLAAHILGAGQSAAAAKLASAAGQAYGRIRLLRALPSSLARGHSLPPLAEGDGDWGAAARPVLDAANAWLEETRNRLPAAPRAALPAILPAALVGPYLRALQRLGPDIAREKADISPLTRVWRLWWGSVRRRI
jgi:15-cis-phytoene synthase